MTADQKHPADEIGKALARANGILTLLSSCFDKPTGTFETGGNFVYESIVTVEAIVENANRALAQLYQTCDLTVVREMMPQAAQHEHVPADPARQAAPVMQADILPITAAFANAASSHNRFGAPVDNSAYLSFFGPTEASSRSVERFENSSANLTDRPAENYDELLQKLMAMADQAAHQSPTEHGLAPALEGLRADLIKLRSVA